MARPYIGKGKKVPPPVNAGLRLETLFKDRERQLRVNRHRI
jgi:hypothetical protein